MTNYNVPPDLESWDRQIAQLQQRNEQLTEALRLIVQWSEAYPLTVFPEPDFIKARQLLEAGGMTLDAISASCMRHLIAGVTGIARDALKCEP
jgi:hypothetical protein